MSFKNVIGLGVAGNFAGHLEQAGEDKDFLKVQVADAVAPKGIFPFYVPNLDANQTVVPSYLSVYPVTHGELVGPANKEENLQAEPEVAILCDIVYEDGKVVNLIPKAFSPYNDCSIRRPGAKKISEKKNWGTNAKGVLPREQMLPIDSFTANGVLNTYKIASFIKRAGTLQEYGVDSFVKHYSYNYEQLVSWMIEKLNNQQCEGPLEYLHSYLEAANYPKEALISIGATRYTEFAQKNYLEDDDLIYVVLYPENLSLAQITEMVANENVTDKKVLMLRQHISYAD